MFPWLSSLHSTFPCIGTWSDPYNGVSFPYPETQRDWDFGLHTVSGGAETYSICFEPRFIQNLIVQYNGCAILFLMDWVWNWWTYINWSHLKRKKTSGGVTWRPEVRGTSWSVTIGVRTRNTNETVERGCLKSSQEGFASPCSHWGSSKASVLMLFKNLVD